MSIKHKVGGVNLEDLKPAIEKVRLALFIDDDELDLFNKIVDRLEGYEVAYDTLLKENERLSAMDGMAIQLEIAQQEIKRLERINLIATHLMNDKQLVKLGELVNKR